MPRKLIKEPKNLLKRINQLEADYGSKILGQVSNLYFYCFPQPDIPKYRQSEYEEFEEEVINDLRKIKLDIEIDFDSVESKKITKKYYFSQTGTEHSVDIYRWKKEKESLERRIKKLPIGGERDKAKKYLKEVVDLPFISGGRREYAMVYVFLLADLLRAKKNKFWDDAMFIIYFTYYTGFLQDSFGPENFNYKDLDILVTETSGMANEHFKESFFFIKRYDPKRGNTYKDTDLKRRLTELDQSFKRKYLKFDKQKNNLKSKLVERFIKYSREKIINPS